MSSRTQRVSPGILVFPTHAGPKMPRRFSEIYGDFRRFSEILAPAPNVPKTLTGAANLNQAHGDFGAVPFGLIKLLREYGTPLALASPGALPPRPDGRELPWELHHHSRVPQGDGSREVAASEFYGAPFRQTGPSAIVEKTAMAWCVGSPGASELS